MKRNVIGYSQMSHLVLNQGIESVPFFFSSPSCTFVGQGVEHEFNQVIPFSELANTAKTVLKDAKISEDDNPILFGIVPFSEDHPTRFVIPQELSVSSRTHAQTKKSETSSNGHLISAPTGAKYKQGVLDAIELFATTELSKVVLSRAIEVATDEDIDLPSLLQNLLLSNPHGYTFSAGLENGNTLMGASPELLVAKRGTHVISNPLAGSRPRTNDAEINERHREELFNSDKDLHEHRVVVEEVERTLSRYCNPLYTPMMPSVIETKTMLHLSTLLEGEVVDPDVSALTVAAALHPTPAVCGYPRQTAYDAIRKLEEFDRGYFTGMVGWCDSRGNGEWVITIRCAEVQKRSMKVFAGAGIVDQSLPESELDETGAKMSTFLSAAGIDLKEMLMA